MNISSLSSTYVIHPLCDLWLPHTDGEKIQLLYPPSSNNCLSLLQNNDLPHRTNRIADDVHGVHGVHQNYFTVDELTLRVWTVLIRQPFILTKDSLTWWRSIPFCDWLLSNIWQTQLIYRYSVVKNVPVCLPMFQFWCRKLLYYMCNLMFVWRSSYFRRILSRFFTLCITFA